MLTFSGRKAPGKSGGHPHNHKNCRQFREENVMTRSKAFAVIGITTALGILDAASAAASDHNGNQDRPRSFVLPCSLDGVNPAYHPEIFGNPAAAAEYGFVRARDGSWHVQPGCRR
jgi:hypothetical protein